MKKYSVNFTISGEAFFTTLRSDSHLSLGRTKELIVSKYKASSKEIEILSVR